ncbi:MAG: insulinase family protein [Bdellovibrionales bacterium]|nr:insulinase family protein [Bdellovibrionales bacterium]
MSTSQKPEEHVLSNGIPVVLQHLDGPVGTFHWWNLTGSTDERAEEAGFAHFLEHMLFKDSGAKETGTASTGKTARVIESLGGEINAYTTFDQTVYHVTCSEQFWESAIDHFGKMAKPQKFLRDDFEREREVILEELRRGEDSPDRQLYQSLFHLTYRKHPYGRPVIGFEKTLKTATVQKLESYYRRNYVSARMGLVLVGPIQDRTGARKKKLLSILEKRFGSGVISRRSAPDSSGVIEKPLQRPRFLSKHFDIKSPEMVASFRIPELTHPDSPLLEVLAGVLGSGESSRLYQRLFYNKALVTDASASVYIPKNPGMFLISAEMKKTSDLAPLLEEIFDEINLVSRGDARKDEIERVITNIESEKLYATQTVDGLASRLGFLKFSLGDLRFDSEYLDQIKAVTPSTLKRLSHQYLTRSRSSLVLFQPNGEPLQSFDGMEKLIPEPTSVGHIETRTKKVDGGGPEIFTLSSGLRVSFFERKGSPVYSIYAAAFGGSRSELKMDKGLLGGSNLLSRTWAKGTQKRDSKEISAMVEGAAASLDGFSGRNSLGLQSTGLTRDWDRLSSLFTEVLLEPSFSEDELSHAKRVIEDQIKSIPDHSSQVCSKLFLENLFGDHPYSAHPYGTLEHVERLQRSHVQHLHSTFINPKNMVLSICGGISREELDSWLSDLDQRIKEQKSTFHQGLIHPPAALKAPRWAGASFGREQTHIMVGGMGVTMYQPERHALRILQNILGGQSGRLFIELREKRSMAYSVSPVSMEGLEAGYAGTYIACAPDKKDDAISEIHRVIEVMAKKGPTRAEMDRAKNYYLGQRAMDLQATWSLASNFGLELLFKDSVTSEAEVRKSIERVTPTQVRSVCHNLLLHAPQVTVVVS